MMNVARGAALILSKAQVIGVNYRTVADPFVNGFLFIGQGKLFDTIPMMALFLIVITLVSYLLFNRTIFGFHLRAVGGNPVAARAAGLDAIRIKIIAFTSGEPSQRAERHPEPLVSRQRAGDDRAAGSSST